MSKNYVKKIKLALTVEYIRDGQPFTLKTSQVIKRATKEEDEDDSFTHDEFLSRSKILQASIDGTVGSDWEEPQFQKKLSEFFDRS